MRFIIKRINPAGESQLIDGRGWLTTFNDMITLLMVIFVLFFSMGSMDTKRFKHFQNALQSAMGVLNEGRDSALGIIDDIKEAVSQSEPGGTTSATPENSRELMDNPNELEAEYTSGGIHLTLDDRLLFASGSAQLTSGGVVLMEKVAGIIKPLKRAIRVEGHTDNQPIATDSFPSNWELSTARAIAVVKFLIDESGIAPEYLAAAGYGDSKPRAPNDSEFNMSRNRRVEILLGPVADLNPSNRD